MVLVVVFALFVFMLALLCSCVATAFSVNEDLYINNTIHTGSIFACSIMGVWGWQWHQLDHIQTTSLQTDNHTNTSSLRDAQPSVLKQSLRFCAKCVHFRNWDSVSIVEYAQAQCDHASRKRIMTRIESNVPWAHVRESGSSPVRFLSTVDVRHQSGQKVGSGRNSPSFPGFSRTINLLFHRLLRQKVNVMMTFISGHSTSTPAIYQLTTELWPCKSKLQIHDKSR